MTTRPPSPLASSLRKCHVLSVVMCYMWHRACECDWLATRESIKIQGIPENCIVSIVEVGPGDRENIIWNCDSWPFFSAFKKHRAPCSHFPVMPCIFSGSTTDHHLRVWFLRMWKKLWVLWSTDTPLPRIQPGFQPKTMVSRIELIHFIPFLFLFLFMMIPFRM